MRSRRFPFLFLVLPAFLASSCTSDRINPQLDTQKFNTFSGTSILCFDLSSETRDPVAGLLLRVSSTPKGTRKNILLPFQSSNITPNRSILLTSGVYDNRFTLIGMSFGTPSLGTPTVSLLPQLEPSFPEKLDIQGAKPGLYFQKNGLERKFIFIDNSPAILSELQRNFPDIQFERFDSVAVSIPDDAQGSDIQPGVSVVPTPSSRIDKVMHFDTSGKKAAFRIGIRYIVPPTPAQIAASNTLLKLFFLLVIPIVTLIFSDPNEIQRPRLRTIFIGGGIFLQLILVVIVVWVTVVIRSPSIEAWLDFGTAGIGVISEVVVILVKTKKKSINSGAPP
jgi:hypothetical protein